MKLQKQFWIPIWKNFILINITLSSDPEYIYKEHPWEYRWNILIKSATKIPHNKPDLIIWNKETKLCSIIEFSCSFDTNIGRKVNEELEIYDPLVWNFQILYPNYKYKVAPIIIGAMGFVLKSLINYLKMIGFDERESKTLTRILKVKLILGTVKICKTFLSFNDPFNSWNSEGLRLHDCFRPCLSTWVCLSLIWCYLI